MGYRYGPGRMTFGFGPGLGPTVKALLAANITVYVVQILLRGDARDAFLQLFGLVPALALPKLHLWQFVTYMFLHGGFWHLAFNMFALWMFGSDIEALWGRRTFLQYYFVSGLGGGLTYTLTAWGSSTPLVGASGAIFGILGAAFVLERQGAMVFGGQALAMIVINLVFTFAVGGISIGGHIGGLIGGALCMLAMSRFGRGHAVYGKPGLVGIAGVIGVGVASVVVAYLAV